MLQAVGCTHPNQGILDGRALEVVAFVLNNGRRKRPVMKRLKAQAAAGPGHRAESSVDSERNAPSDPQSRQLGNTLPPQGTSEPTRREARLNSFPLISSWLSLHVRRSRANKKLPGI